MSTDKWIKKNVVYIHNGILFILKKERKPDNCDYINEPGRHYKWNKKKREGKKNCKPSLVLGIKKGKERQCWTCRNRG